MPGLWRTGGIAAAVQAVAYLSGFALFLLILSPPGDPGPAERIAFLVANKPASTAAMLVTYMLTGIATVVMSIAFHDRSRVGAPALSQVAAAFGLIWGGLLLASGGVAIVGLDAVADLHRRDPAGAEALWRAVAVVQDGLGGGNEVVGGLWVGLASGAARRAGGLPRPLAGAGLLIGSVGVITALPIFASLTDLFGLALIGWFAALSVVMLRPTPGPRLG